MKLSVASDTGDWSKSSYSTALGQCVEVTSRNGDVLVRDSKDLDGPVLSFTQETWESFLADIKR